jgi:hypothetical protein
MVAGHRKSTEVLMTDRQSYDPWAPPPAPDPVQAHETLQTLTGVVQPPEPVEQDQTADGPTGDATAAAGLIPDDLDDITKDELIELAEMAGVATYGTKAQLAARIRAV